MTITYIIPANVLAALIEFAPKRDARQYLCAVHVRPLEGGLRVEATNGAALAIMHVPCSDALPTDGFLIPRELIAQIKPKAGDVEVEFEPDNAKSITLRYGDMQVSARCDLGRFPDTRAVVLTVKPSGEAAGFDPAVLTLFWKAAKALGLGPKPTISIAHNGEGAARVMVGERDDFIGVIMPLRHASATPESLTTPGWAAE